MKSVDKFLGLNVVCPLLIGAIKRGMLAVAVLSLWLAGTGNVRAGERLWLLIDASEMSLSVMQGNVVLRTYTNISIGRSGAAEQKQKRDGKTPLGEFHIIRMVTDSPFHLFFELDYPNLQHAERGRDAEIITELEYLAIRKALRAGRLPSQDTALGGNIGIHGIGQGSVSVHEDFNWTLGCVALTNAQIEELYQQVHIGMKVVIRH